LETWVVVGFLGTCQGCTRPTTEFPHPAAPLPFEGTSKYWGHGVWSPHVRGQVELDGLPVRHFAVVVSDHEALLDLQVPTVLDEPSGRFSVPVAHDGRWFVAVSGTGFARTSMTIDVGGDTHLVRIDVNHGRTITGSVVDEAGNLRSGAIVEIAQTGEQPSEDPVWEMSKGNLSVRTDQNGKYKISGFCQRFEVARISTSIRSEHLASLPEKIEADGDEYRMVLHETGGVRGRVEGAFPADAAVLLRSSDSRVLPLALEITRDGSFGMDEIPSGRYQATFWYPSSPRSAANVGVIIIVSGKVTQLTIPKHLVPRE